MTIEVTRGSLSDYTFFIMENESTNIHEASLPPTGTLGDTISP
ncbi:MAG: glucoamylase, partial [Cutibacterium avidum]|nr:glucoamylase [Cutibacterium avidum]